MNFVFDISPLIKLTLVFVLIIVLIRQKVSLGTSLTTGAVVMGLWFRLSPLEILASLFGALTSSETIILFLVVTLILILSHSLEKSGQMKRLLASFSGISRNPRLNLALFPAIIGLLPMPGGAIFSAPMVHEVSREKNLTPRHKTLINYWFRHIWEFCWPLYPGVILTCSLSGIDLATFVVAQFPMTLLMASVGYFTQLKPLRLTKASQPVDPNTNRRDFFVELTPILIVIGGGIILGTVVHLMGNYWPAFRLVRKEVSLIAALLISIVWVWRYNRMAGNQIKQIFLNKSIASMIFMIAGIMIFQGILEDSHAVTDISQSLTAARVPVVLVIVILPFLVGTITGITVAFVGATFPILLSLIANSPMADTLLAYTVLAFCSGYLGVLLSPLHVCLILTCEYFHTALIHIYRRLWLPAAVLALGGLISFWILHLI
jgi:hypothetical protein